MRDRLALLEEHAWLRHLSQRSPLFQSPLPIESGDTVVSEGPWTYEVFPHTVGVDVYEQAHSWTPFFTIGHAHSAGKALAALHDASASYAGPDRAARTLVTRFSVFSSVDPWPVLSSYIGSRASLRTYLGNRDFLAEAKSSFESWHQTLVPFLPKLAPLWTHNDFHASNLMWRDNSPTSEVAEIFDMGLASRTNAIHDLATAIERNGIEWLRIHEDSFNPLHLDHIDALLEGYEQRRPLSRDQAAALVALLPLVHAEFALSETDYFFRVLNSRTKADLAYDGYFLGHARWFATPRGRQLLDHLQEWAEKHPTSIIPNSAQSIVGTDVTT